MAAGNAGASETRPDRYLDDISEDEVSANAPPDETAADKNARRVATESRTNDTDISERLSLSGTSTRLWIKLPTDSTPLLSNASCLSPR
jgi:hypothetical protein